MKTFISLIFSLFTAVAMAQSFVDPNSGKLQVTPVGKVMMLKGEATRTPYSDRKAFLPLKEGSDLFSGDDLKTADGAVLKVEMTDDTVITLGPASHFEIVLYNFESKTNRNATFDLKAGHLRSDVKQPVKNNELTYKVGKVAMGIRGTQIVAEIVKQNKEDVTKVAIIEGKAFVDISSLGHKTLKKIGLDIGKILSTKKFKPDAKEEDFLVQLTPEQLKRLLFPAGELGATFLKDLEEPVLTTKKSLKDSVNSALTPVAASTEAPKALAPTEEESDVTLQKKKKVWSEILEEDQNNKDGNP